MKSLIEVTLRKWNKEDFETVKKILLTTWKNTYSFIPVDDILFHFEKYYSNDKLLEILNDPLSEGIIADVHLKPAGWMKLFEDKLNKRFYVSSLYVLPNFQGLGIGKKLLNESYLIAKHKTYDRVWLGVMKDNVKSLEWYKHIGFIFIEEEPFKMGSTEVIHLIGYKII